ncbi:rod shape-determining protein MreC [Candidatus Wolfebacteria bacterium]|nr:rod shape-determining protein MreC [Candidatus Wolfebacteria bacterium]
MRRYFILILIILFLAITYFVGFFIRKEKLANENLNLIRENSELRAVIQQMIIDIQPKVDNYLSAKIFSTYPFNIKNQITVNIGKNQGVAKGMVATVENNLLLGQVVEVFNEYSIIQTIFDPNLQLPVRIGKEGVDGLFQAGNEPKVTLIEKQMPIEIGDIVYSSSKEFPYGLKLGEVSEIRETAAGVFKDAILRFPFNVNKLREIKIIKTNNE